MNYSTGSNKKVLFVDDEELVLEKIKTKLAGEDFEVHFADSGQKALKVISEHRPAVVVIDLNMEEFSGIELIKIINQNYSDIIKIIFSVYTDSNIILKTHKYNIYQYIPKKRINKKYGYELEVIPVLKNAIELYNLRREKNYLIKILDKNNIL
jgi:DNA-binding NtrC family response regulator